jgi:hypothetical protein
MKLVVLISSFLIVFLLACNNSDKQGEGQSQNDMDAARNFLDAALKGDFRNASTYMLQDSANLGYLNVTQRNYQHLDPIKKDSLKNASLRFYDTKQVNDSTTITIFANSYKNDKDTLKIIRVNGQWLVDLKYLFEHSLDTNHYGQKPGIDTISK